MRLAMSLKMIQNSPKSITWTWKLENLSWSMKQSLVANSLKFQRMDSIFTLGSNMSSAFCQLKIIHWSRGKPILWLNVRMNFGDSLTSLDIHPIQNYIAAGFRSGKIQICYNLLIPNEKPIQTKLHWHASTVSALKFTDDGAYLLSGGEEAVLVMWQLGSKDRTYLPRLQSEITSITMSPDHLYYAMTHSDNTIRLVSTSNYAVREIVVGLMGANTCHQFPMYVGLQVNPRTGHVLINGSPASLQLFDAVTDRHISEIEVTPMNKVSKSHSQQYASRIKHAAFSKDGLWMATVDVRRTEDITESYIKFWQFDQDSQTYMVNTRIFNPHDSDLTCLQFGEWDDKLICVTCGKDSKFKLWQLNPPTSEVEEPHWTGRSSVHCAGVPKTACFNEDGSLIAVAIDSSITLWNSITNAMVGSLDYYSLKEKLNYISFLAGTPYLIASSDHYVHVWDLLSCQVIWVLKSQVRAVKTDPLSSQFVVVGPNSLTVYDSSFQPLYTKRLPYDALTVTFLTKKSQSTAPFDHQLLILTTQFDLFILGTPTNEEIEYQKMKQVEEKEGLFTGIYGKSSRSSNKIEALNKVGQVFPFLDLPSHSMPTPSTLVQPFFNAILKPKSNQIVVSTSPQNVASEPVTLPMSLDKKYHLLEISEMAKMISQIVFQ
jgi:NET1-associated nuclear protein 1 (U3 small nucleolar RNA-associated protein 17)